MNGRVALVTNIPRPYRRALFDTLREQLAPNGLELRVLYTSDPGKHVRRGVTPTDIYDPDTETFVPEISLRLGYEKVLAVPTGLARILGQHQPVCVISGGFGPSALLCASWCRHKGVPLVLWSGAWPRGEPEVGMVESALRKRLVRRCDAYVTYGTDAADYLVSLGARSSAISCGWNTVDLEGVASLAQAATARRREFETRYGLAPKNLLFVGSLVERKGLRELVSAALSPRVPGVNWALHLAGDGPLRRELESAVRSANAEARFRFHGLIPGTSVAELLGLVDGLVLPTKQEVWGLVINEAMACGVPVVASPWAGATRDLIEDGVTGYVVDPTTPGSGGHHVTPPGRRP